MKNLLRLLMVAVIVSSTAMAQTKESDALIELDLHMEVYGFGLQLKEIKINEVKNPSLARLLANLYLYKIRYYDDDLVFDPEEIGASEGKSLEIKFASASNERQGAKEVYEMYRELEEHDRLSYESVSNKTKEFHRNAAEDLRKEIQEFVKTNDELGFMNWDVISEVHYTKEPSVFSWKVNNLSALFPNGELPAAADESDKIKIRIHCRESTTAANTEHSDDDETKSDKEINNIYGKSSDNPADWATYTWTPTLGELKRGKEFRVHYKQYDPKSAKGGGGDSKRLFDVYFSLSGSDLSVEKASFPMPLVDGVEDHRVVAAATKLILAKVAPGATISYDEPSKEEAEEGGYILDINIADGSLNGVLPSERQTKGEDDNKRVITNGTIGTMVVNSAKMEIALDNFASVFREANLDQINTTFKGKYPVMVYIRFEEPTDHAANTDVPVESVDGQDQYVWAVSLEDIIEGMSDSGSEFKPWIFRTYFDTDVK